MNTAQAYNKRVWYKISTQAYKNKLVTQYSNTRLYQYYATQYCNTRLQQKNITQATDKIWDRQGRLYSCSATKNNVIYLRWEHNIASQDNEMIHDCNTRLQGSNVNNFWLIAGSYTPCWQNYSKCIYWPKVKKKWKQYFLTDLGELFS